MFTYLSSMGETLCIRFVIKFMSVQSLHNDNRQTKRIFFSLLYHNRWSIIWSLFHHFSSVFDSNLNSSNHTFFPLSLDLESSTAHSIYQNKTKRCLHIQKTVEFIACHQLNVYQQSRNCVIAVIFIRFIFFSVSFFFCFIHYLLLHICV